MAKQSQLFLTWKYRTTATIFANSDSTSIKQICQSGLDINAVQNDSNIMSCVITSNDTVDNYINLYLTDGSTNYNWLSIKIPAVPSGQYYSTVDAFATLGSGVSADSANNFYYKLAAGWYLLAGFQNAISSGKQSSIICICEDF